MGSDPTVTLTEFEASEVDRSAPVLQKHAVGQRVRNHSLYIGSLASDLSETRDDVYSVDQYADTLSELTEDAGITVQSPLFLAGGGAVNEETLGDNKTIAITDAQVHKLDPDGSPRTITLPPEQVGAWYLIQNTAGGAENLVIVDDAAGAVATLNQNEGAWVFCDGAAWHAIGFTTVVDLSA